MILVEAIVTLADCADDVNGGVNMADSPWLDDELNVGVGGHWRYSRYR